MKVKTETLPPWLLPMRSRMLDYLALVKFRLMALVLVSTSMGFYLSFTAESNLWHFIATLAGVALVGSGANTLNQWYERDIDVLMQRTRNRPLPAKRLTGSNALIFGLLITLAGFLLLGTQVNLLTLGLSFVSWATYLFIYTPMKQVSVLNTWIGAIPGALPAVLGCTAASGTLGWEATSLFMILFFWQMPHFFAISWVYRDDYLRGGLKMLSGPDLDGRRTARQITLNTLLLIIASVSLFLLPSTGLIYLAVALMAGAMFLAHALAFQRQISIRNARRVFFASILYLPVLFLAIIADRLF